MITGKQLLSGKSYRVSKDITISIPTIRQILEFGAQKYFDMVWSLCFYVSDVEGIEELLCENGMNLDEITDFMTFGSKIYNNMIKNTELLFGGFDFSRLILVRNDLTGRNVIASDENGTLRPVINEAIYTDMIDCVRKAHGIEDDGCKTYKYLLSALSKSGADYLDLPISTFNILVRCGAILPKFEVVLDKENKE